MYYHFLGGSDSKASAYNAGDPGSIPGWGRPPGEGNGTPLQYSCLENPMGWRSVGSQREELRPWQRSWGRKLGIRKGVIKPQETPCSRTSTLKTRVLYGELSLITISLREGVNLQLQLIKIPGRDKSVSTYELWRFSGLPDQARPAACDCLQPPNCERHGMF